MIRIVAHDNNGRIQDWLDRGRGVNVWQSQLLGHDAGRLAFTPGDVDSPPHWRFTLACTIHDIASFLLFRKVGVVQTFTDTPQGWSAAGRRIDQLPTLSNRQAPIGRVWTCYTLQSLRYHTEHTVDMRGYERPLDSKFHVGVVEWACVDEV